MTEIPEPYPVTRQVVTAQDALRDRIIELEAALAMNAPNGALEARCKRQRR